MYPDKQTYIEFFNQEGQTIACSFCPIATKDYLYGNSYLTIMLPLPQRMYVKCKIVDDESKLSWIRVWNTEEERFTSNPHLKYFAEKVLPGIESQLNGKKIQISVLSEIDAGYGCGSVSLMVACITQYLYQNKIIDDLGDFIKQSRVHIKKYVTISSLLSVIRRSNMHANFIATKPCDSSELYKNTEILNPDKQFYDQIEFYTDRDCNMNIYNIFDVAIINVGAQSCQVDVIDLEKNNIQYNEQRKKEIFEKVAKEYGQDLASILDSSQENEHIRPRIVAEFFKSVTAEYKSVDEIFSALYKLSKVCNIEKGFDPFMRQLRVGLGADALVFHNAAMNRITIISRLNSIRKKIEELEIGKEFFYSWHEYQKPQELGEYDDEGQGYACCILEQSGSQFYMDTTKSQDADILFNCTENRAFIQQEQIRSKKMPSVRFTIETLTALAKSSSISSRSLPKSSYSISRSAFVSKIASPLKKITEIELVTQGTEVEFTISVNFNNKKIALIK